MKLKSVLFSLLSLIFLLAGPTTWATHIGLGLLAMSSKKPSQAQAGSSNGQSAPPNQNDSLYDKATKAVPDGQSISFADFRKKAGDKIANLLAFASPTKISRKGNHITLDCANGASISHGGKTLTCGSKVEFDLVPNGTVLELANVKGVTITVGSVPMDLKEANIQPDANGNTQVDGSLEVSRWLPNIPFSVTLGPDGKPV